MARLVDEDTEYLQLFYDVLPAFIEALPPRPSAAPANNRKQETLKNLISILRFEMQQMQQILTKTHTEYDLMDEDIFKVPDVSDALEDVLFCLEGLVNKVTNDNLVSYVRLTLCRLLPSFYIIDAREIPSINRYSGLMYEFSQASQLEIPDA